VADTRERMFSLTLELCRKFLVRFVQPQQPVEDYVRLLIEDMLPELVAKAGNQNPRIRRLAFEFIHWLAEFHVSFVSLVYASVLQPLRNPAVSRLFLARLELASMLLRDPQLSDVNAYFESTTTLALSALDHTHKEIRESGYALLGLLYSIFGPRLLQFLSTTKYYHLAVEVGI
jgi:hypothetical protein